VDLSKVCICEKNTLREAMECIDLSGKGIALVIGDDRKLLFTITDGDLRRAVLNGLDLNLTVSEWAKKRTEHGNLSPVMMPLNTPPSELLRRMQDEDLRHIPLLDAEGRLADLAMLSEMVIGDTPDLSAVIMAGGFGARLRPLTEDLPKPMLPVGDKPMMEHIINQLHTAGIRQVNITTHYKPETIVDHFGNGERFGLGIHYVNEDRPLGTAGALGLMEPWDSTLLVINGDILTRLNFQAMLSFHRENKAVMTVGVRSYETQIPFGVVDLDGVSITRLTEKPVIKNFVNAGVYLLEPEVYRIIPKQQRIDMTDVINRLLAQKTKVVSFPISEYWQDIGQHGDYQKARDDYGREEKQ
jgi:dTDP-glucose pyrophosphorylase